MSNPQLTVGPDDSASLLYDDSILQLGQLTLNDDTSGLIIQSVNSLSSIQGSLGISSNLFLGATARWKMNVNGSNEMCFYQLNTLGTSYVLMSKMNSHGF